MKLTFDEQNNLAKTIEGYFFDNRTEKQPELATLRFNNYRNEGSSGLGLAETTKEGTMVVLENWYSRTIRRMETK